MPENVDLTKWKRMANQVLGEEFFTDFISDVRRESPRHNIYKGNSEIIVLIELPHVLNTSDIKLSVTEQELMIKAQIHLGFDHLEKIESQILTGYVEKKISLPCSVNTKKINAKYQKGILKVQLFPKISGKERYINISE